MLHLKKSYFQDKNSTEILSFLQMDVSQVSSVTDRYTVLSVSYVFRIVSGLIGLFLISWKLALIVLCMVPVKFLLVRGLSKRQEQAMDEMIESSRDFSRWFGDDLNGVDEIKLWDLFQSRDQVFREKQEKVLGVQKRTTMIGGWNSFWEMLLEWSVTILLYVLGGWLICTGGLTIGAVFAFVSYSGYVTGPVSALINLKMYFARIFPSARRLFRFLDMETELDAGTSPLKGWPPKLEFRNVEFWYEEERPILQGVTFSVEPGEKVAIIGQNGSGKSTILNLLLRFYVPDAGQILADDTDIQEIPLEEYRSLFSVVEPGTLPVFGKHFGKRGFARERRPRKAPGCLAVQRGGRLPAPNAGKGADADRSKRRSAVRRREAEAGGGASHFKGRPSGNFGRGHRFMYLYTKGK